MAKECGPSAAQDKLNETIAGAKSEVDSLIGDSIGGLADSNVPLKDKISGLTDGIKADLEVATPEIPEPAFKLHDQMTNLLNNTGDPGKLIQEMEQIKDKFGDKVDVDSMFDEFGLDSVKLKEANDKFNSKLKESKLLQNLENIGEEVKGSANLDLLKLGQGDADAIAKLVGLDNIFKPGNTQNDLLDKVCTSIPNLEMDADGNVIEKGPETKIPEEDAEADNDTVDVKAELEPEVIDVSLEIVDQLNKSFEELDGEPLDFGPPIDPSEIIRDEFEADSLELKQLNEQAREQRKLNRESNPTPRADVYFINALNKTIDLFSKNIDIKYNILTLDDPKALTDTEFKVRNKFLAKSRKERLAKGEALLKLSGPEFKTQFKSPPPGSDQGRLNNLIAIIKKLEYVKILEEE